MIWAVRAAGVNGTYGKSVDVKWHSRRSDWALLNSVCHYSRVMYTLLYLTRGSAKVSMVTWQQDSGFNIGLGKSTRKIFIAKFSDIHTITTFIRTYYAMEIRTK